jgi:hypothetical protein
MSRRPLLVLVGGGVAWTLHLFAGYFLVSVGCPRAWPALGWWIAAATALTATAAIGVGVSGLRAWRRSRPGENDADAEEARRLVFAVGGLLAALFTVAILLAGLAAVVLPPCQSMAAAR